MTREQYKSLQLVQLKELAKSRGLKHISGLKKDELIDRMLEEDAREAAEKETAAQEEETPSVEKEKQEETFRPRQNTYTNRNYNRTRRIPGPIPMEEIRKMSGALRRIATGIRTIRTADTAIPITGIRTARKTMATVTIAARTRIQRITEATAITIIETIRKITAMETAPSIRRMAVIIRGIRKIVRKILTREIRTIPRSVPVRTGRTKIARHRISDSWIPVRLLAVFWRLCRMALVLSEATIICRETTTSMFPLLRSAVSI